MTATHTDTETQIDPLRLAVCETRRQSSVLVQILDDGGPEAKFHRDLRLCASNVVQRAQEAIKRSIEQCGHEYADVVAHGFVDHLALEPFAPVRVCDAPRGGRAFELTDRPITVDVTDCDKCARELRGLIKTGSGDVEVRFLRGSFWSIGDRQFVPYSVEFA